MPRLWPFRHSASYAAAAEDGELAGARTGDGFLQARMRPDEWKDVSFENIALSDGRRVSGRRLDGKVKIVVH